MPGAGSYEPPDRLVAALEPSMVMMGQRSVVAAPVVRGVAERLPFADQAFDTALAVLPVHHWSDAPAGLACLQAVRAGLAGGRELQTVVVPVPGDCTDGFLGAYWRRPRAYLDPVVRASISGLARLDEDVVGAAHARLAADLVSGRWRERHRQLLDRPELDLGYRLVTAE